MEARMRTVIVLVFAAVVVAIGLGMKTVFISGPEANVESPISKADTSPYEIHLNIPNMKDMPVLEIKDLI
jgi:hypothetical protein